ncbi:MAG TPA: dephospho-CoA kinase [Acidimicrobiales bacterium]|nr:dephospho-CoA kinase [Acidimicrobiales bacterium]
MSGGGVVVACTGGIGAGKSSVGRLLAARGAVVVDADAAAREVVAAGSAVLGAVRERFGDEVLSRDGTLDRGALAAVVFHDGAARRDLEAIMHPAISELLERRVGELRRRDEVAVLELPLLVGADVRQRYDLDGVLLVDVPEEVALDRLAVGGRITPDDARTRMAAQPSRAERLANADFVILNLGSPAELAEMVDRAWSWIVSLEAGRAAAR